MSIISIFNAIRDIPYRIPLTTEEEDNCCSGKHEKLSSVLTKLGYTVRYRVCVFLWSRIDLPSKLVNIPHEDECTHTFLEISIDGHWKILDATWDTKLRKVFHINEWDGKSDTKIAMTPIKIFTPQKSLEIMNNQNQDGINDDLKINGEFYKGFNEWLTNNRR